MSTMKPLIITIVAWTIASALFAYAWYDLMYSFTHEMRGIIPTGYMSSMLCLTGLGVGLAGNGIASAIKK